MSAHKIVSQPCLRNQEPIYQHLHPHFNQAGTVLELGCGTAQHAVYFAQRCPHLQWIASDLRENLEAAKVWIEEAGLDNLAPPQALNMEQGPWPACEYIYSANLVHYVSMHSVEKMFQLIGQTLRPNGLLALYGPYNQNGYTSDGNRALDEWLKNEVNAQAGIKELSLMEELAQAQGLNLIHNHLLPANNHLLIFQQQSLN